MADDVATITIIDAGHQRHMTPKQRLWDELRNDFVEDDDSYHPGGDVWFEGLSANDVARLWAHVARHAISVRVTQAWFQGAETELEDVEDAVAQFERGRADYVRLSADGLECHGEVLPLMHFELFPDLFSMYWWVNHPADRWTPEGVAALARLLGDLRSFVPHARLEYEYSDSHDFWGSVERFLATDASRVDS